MKDERCPLSWKAAALEDGRLEGADRASFELHASRCADCRAESKALAALNDRMRAAPARDLAPLERARLRASLLARANERFVGRGRARGNARWMLAAVVVAAVAVLVVVGVRSARMTAGVRGTAEVSAHFEVVAAPHAVWRTQSLGATERVELADGAARFEVAPLGANQRFLVALPDGELEIEGRRFAVDVALGRTKSVSVMDGTVIFRRRGASELVLRAGEGWTRTDAITAARDEASALVASTATATATSTSTSASAKWARS